MEKDWLRFDLPALIMYSELEPNVSGSILTTFVGRDLDPVRLTGFLLSRG